MSKFKACSHDKFYSRTFDLFMISSSRYLVFGVYLSPHQRNILRKSKLYGKES